MTGHVRSESARTGHALGLLGPAELPLQGLNSAVALVLCNGAEGSEPFAHDEPSISRGIPCVQEMARNHRDRAEQALHDLVCN